MAGVYDTCARCGAQMIHAAGRGRARKYCSDNCQAEADAARAAAKKLEPCSVAGCGGLANRPRLGFCELHYMRNRRHGSTEKASQAIPGDLLHSNGYVLQAAPDHPRARGRYRAYQHRVVFTEHNGEGPFNCHWCNVRVTWEDMHIDHLDDDPQNNDISNLAPSCPTCNQKRGEWKMRQKLRERHGLTLNGVTKTLNEWAEVIGISRVSIKWRLANGWPLERALTEPRGKFGPRGQER
jgi:hypothetical protein